MNRPIVTMGTLICFNCCITEQPQMQKRIDRTMIGSPTNFRHTAHIGSGDVASNVPSKRISNIQEQMSSKGEHYNSAVPIALHFSTIDLPIRSPSSNSLAISAHA